MQFKFHPQFKGKLLHKLVETNRLSLTLLHSRHVSPKQRDEKTFIRMSFRWERQYVFNLFLYLRCKGARSYQILLTVFADATGVEVAFYLSEPGQNVLMRHAECMQNWNTAVVWRVLPRGSHLPLGLSCFTFVHIQCGVVVLGMGSCGGGVGPLVLRLRRLHLCLEGLPFSHFAQFPGEEAGTLILGVGRSGGRVAGLVSGMSRLHPLELRPFAFTECPGG